MPRERSDMRRVKELLRLAHELGYSKRQIALSIRMPKTTVGDYLARAAAAGLRYADVAGMSEEAVEALLFQRAELPEQRPMPDWEWVSAELGRRGVTLMLVWEEYRQQHRDGYSYSQFRRHFLDHTSASAEPRMRREHAPGAACEVDYAGMTLTISTAEGPRQASVFVGCLPFSGYLYAEATWTQTAEDWLASHVRMFSHLDGVVPKLVPDNLKTGITHASFYDPVVNRSYHELARHYGTGVVPTRVRRPRDKASAEKGVQVVETRVLAAAAQSRVLHAGRGQRGDPGAGRRGQRAAADDQQDADPAQAVRGAGEAAPDAAAGGALRDRPLVPLQAGARLSRQHRGRGLLGALPADRQARRCVQHGQPGQHLPQGPAGRGPCPPGGRTGAGDGDARRASAAQSPRRGAADARRQSGPRLPASVARSGCWPTGSSPMPIIPTRPRARSPACCDWASCTAPWLCRPPRRRR